jgi:hypothetical protein
MLTCDDCLTRMAPETRACPNCGSDSLRAPREGDDAATLAKGLVPEPAPHPGGRKGYEKRSPGGES